ncbi:MAG: SDR family oxidoreductase [Desulfobacteraceae bacterium]|nr:SDR family oxidoreductase [Desulfobacteraceae bacterium]
MTDQTAKTALVTGGAQGIGRAIAEQFLADGMNVLIADCDKEACQETAEELEKNGNPVALCCDVSDEQDVKTAVSETLRQFARLDVLICNAGISGFFGVPVTELSLEQWQRVIGVNLTGCFLCAKHAAPYLGKTGGCIINIASTRALQSEPHTEAYSASKGGIVAFTHALSVSMGPQVRVNCISPGWIETAEWQKKSRRQTPALSETDHAQHPAGRVGVPEDVAGLAAFLASNQAGFITGQNFVADGGMTRKMIYLD